MKDRGVFLGSGRVFDAAWPKDNSGEPLTANPVGQSRRWIKLWTEPWLKGTVRFTLDHRERAVWMDLLALAGQSRIGGVICAGIENGAVIGYPILFLAGLVDIPQDELTTMLSKFEVQERIRIKKDERDRIVIHIENWGKYQADYSKQARYRAKKKKNLQ
jgi:hypothetical protein